MAKVKITGHASGSGVITVTAPNTSTDRTITLPDATATIATTTDVAAKAPIASPEFTGNVGVQVTPENWNGARPGLQIGSTGSISGKNDVTDNHMNVTANAFLNRTSLSTGWDYMYTNKATNYYQQDGKHVFRTTPSGTADTAITWTTALEITNDGRGLSQFTAKAWVKFNQTGSQSIDDSHNVSSLTDDNVGVTTINFTNNLGSADYAPSCTINKGSTGNDNYCKVHDLVSTSQLRIINEANSGSNLDTSAVHVIVFGD